MFDILAKFGVDGSGFEHGMKRAEQQVREGSERMTSTLERVFAGGMGTNLFRNFAGAAGLGGVFDLFKELSDEAMRKATETKIGSQLLQVDTDTFQRIRNITEATSTSAETVAKAGTITGEQLSALKAIWGRGGPSLLPAVAKGFSGVAAIQGNMDAEQLKTLDMLKQQGSGAGLMNAEVRNKAGIAGAYFMTMLKMLPGAILGGLDIYTGRKTGAADLFEAGQEAAKVEESTNKKLGELNRERARRHEAEDKKRETEEINAAFDREQREAQQAAAKKSTERLEPMIKKREEEEALAKMSPEERKGHFSKIALSEKELYEHFLDLSQKNPEDALSRNEALQHRLLQMNAEWSLRDLKEPRLHQQAQSLFHIEDRLNRVGGGFASDSELKDPVERTAKACEQTNSILRDIARPGQNPLAGN